MRRLRFDGYHRFGWLQPAEASSQRHCWRCARTGISLGRTRRVLLQTPLAVLIVLLLTLTACQGSTPGQNTPVAGPKELPISESVPAVPGKLLYVKSGAFWTFEPGTKTTQQLVTFPERTFAASPAISPDGTRVAYGLFRLGQGVQDPGGGDLYVMAMDGSRQQLVLAHDAPGVSLVEPAWPPDGQTLYFTRRDLEGEVRIERVRLDGSGRTVVVEGGHSPSLSADGKQLAYLTTDRETLVDTLWIAGSGGTNAKRLLGESQFRALAAPRLTSNGEQIVFAAVERTAPPSSAGSNEPFERLRAWLGPGVAQAHGVPWDIWLVNADGTGLRRLTDLREDSPIPVWSPDEKWIAFSGELGLYLVDVEGKQVLRVSDEFASGGLTWLRRPG